MNSNQSSRRRCKLRSSIILPSPRVAKNQRTTLWALVGAGFWLTAMLAPGSADAISPWLSISLQGPDAVKLTITNGLSDGVYEIWRGESPGSDKGWSRMATGTNGQAEFTVNISQAQRGFFAGVDALGIDGDADYFRSTSPTPPAGVFNSWGDAAINVSASYVTNVAQFILTNGFQRWGFDTIVLDEGWMTANGRDVNSHVLGDRAKFPAGISNMVNYVHSLGLKFGIYWHCGTNSETPGYTGSMANYETSSYGYIVQDALDFAAMGMDYIKLNGAVGPYSPSLDRFNEACQRLFVRTFQSTGRHAYFMMMTPWYTNWLGNWCNDWRGPIIDGNVVLAGGIVDTTIYNFIAKQPYFGQARPGFFPQIEGCGISGGGYYPFPTNFASIASLQAICSSPHIFYSPFWGAQGLAAFTNADIIRVQQDEMVSPATRIFSCPVGGTNREAWMKPLKDGGRAILFLNADSNNWSEVALDSTSLMLTGAVATVRDAWANTEIAYMTNNYTFPAVCGRTTPLYLIKGGKYNPYGYGDFYVSHGILANGKLDFWLGGWASNFSAICGVTHDVASWDVEVTFDFYLDRTRVLLSGALGADQTTNVVLSVADANVMSVLVNGTSPGNTAQYRRAFLANARFSIPNPATSLGETQSLAPPPGAAVVAARHRGQRL